MNIFGFEIKSKEEREQEEREYLHRIFPEARPRRRLWSSSLGKSFPRKIKRQLCFTIFW